MRRVAERLCSARKPPLEDLVAIVNFWYPYPLELRGPQLNPGVVCADEAHDHELHGFDEAQRMMFRILSETEQLYSQPMTGIVVTILFPPRLTIENRRL